MRTAYVFLLLLFTFAGTSHASVVEYTNRDAWMTAAGSHTTITFQGYPANTIITDQYADQGVLFTDGTDRIFPSDNLFPNDGVGLNGAFDEINLAFSQPMHHIGVDFPGAIRIWLYWQGELIHTSSAFGGGGAGFFGGLVSDQPFDAALLADPSGGTFIDDLYFGPPIPAPSALALLAMTALWRSRRRRPPA
jgi:hypothetical protein